MDGRYEETYEPGLLDSLHTIYTEDNWKQELEKRHVDYIIIEKTYKELFDRLSNDKDWHIVMASKKFALFVRSDIKLKNKKKPSEDFNHYQKEKWQTNIDWSTK